MKILQLFQINIERTPSPPTASLFIFLRKQIQLALDQALSARSCERARHGNAELVSPGLQTRYDGGMQFDPAGELRLPARWPCRPACAPSQPPVAACWSGRLAPASSPPV